MSGFGVVPGLRPLQTFCRTSSCSRAHFLRGCIQEFKTLERLRFHCSEVCSVSMCSALHLLLQWLQSSTLSWCVGFTLPHFGASMVPVFDGSSGNFALARRSFMIPQLHLVQSGPSCDIYGMTTCCDSAKDKHN